MKIALWVLVITPVLATLHLVDLGWSSQAGANLRNALHAPIFGFLSLVMAVLFRHRLGAGAALALAAGFSLSAGVIGELLQVIGPRDASLQDLGYDALGIASFMLILAYFDKTIQWPLFGIPRIWSLIIGAPFLAVVIYPAAWYVYAFAARAQAMPQLIVFDDRWAQSFYRPQHNASIERIERPHDWPADSGRVALVTLGNSKYSGIIVEPSPDWTGYSSLSFRVASADNDIHQMTIRVHDRNHNGKLSDRFNQRFEITPEPKVVELSLESVQNAPANRSMRMSAIEALLIFKVAPKGGEKIILDDLWLVRK
jgi:hypothetical protein